MQSSRFVVLALAALLLSVVPAAAQQQTQVFPGLSAEGLEGGFVDIEDFRGRPVLINFWATWCGPCRMELPAIQRLYDSYSGKGLVVMTVNTDASVGRVRPFLDKMDLTLPVYRTTAEDQARLGISSIPATFLLDGEGKIVRAQAGYSSRLEKDLETLIKNLLPPKRT